MKRKQILCALLACLMLLGCTVKVSAAEVRSNQIMPCATGQLNQTISANSFSTSSSFPMEKGEKVMINLTYSPTSASVYCGVVDEGGTFQYLSSTSGSINGSIVINASGNYQLVVYNNSPVSVTVVGTVNY